MVWWEDSLWEGRGIVMKDGGDIVLLHALFSFELGFGSSRCFLFLLLKFVCMEMNCCVGGDDEASW